MKYKQKRLKQGTRQRQKLSRRTVIILAASFVICLSASLTIFFQFSRVDESAAGVKGYSGEFLIDEQVFLNDKVIAEPVIQSRPMPGQDILLTRKVKVVTQTPPPSIQ